MKNMKIKIYDEKELRQKLAEVYAASLTGCFESFVDHVRNGTVGQFSTNKAYMDIVKLRDECRAFNVLIQDFEDCPDLDAVVLRHNDVRGCDTMLFISTREEYHEIIGV